MPRRSFHEQRRTAARLALYSSLAIVTLAGLASYPLVRYNVEISLDQGWANVDFESMAEVDLLRRLVQVDTTTATGSEIAAAELLAAELERAGIPSHIERLAGNKANLWAILEGRDSQAVVLHSHLDTDPILYPDSWVEPPFSGRIEPPWIYGRGVFDMKSVTAAQVMAMKALAEEASERGTPPPRSLIFLATSSEETGSELGAQWILRQHPELVSRFWVLLTEGGVIEALAYDQIKYWGIEFAQKRFVDVVACAPERQRLEDLQRDLIRFGLPSDELRVTPEVEAFLAAYGASRDNSDHVRLLADPHALIRDLPSFSSLPLYLRALFRDEAHPFRIEEDPQTGGYRMRISIHLLPGSDFETVRRRLLPEWLIAGVALRFVVPETAERGSPLDHPAFRTLLDVVSERHAIRKKGPHFLSFYATDSRFFRRAGVASYGFSPFVLLTTDTNTMTGPNERIALPAFVDGVDLYRELVEKLVYGAEN